MFLFEKPSWERIRSFLEAQARSPFSYEEVGATRTEAIPTSYIVDRNCVQLGEGETAFQRAVEAMRHWEMFHFDWLDLCWKDVPLEVGRVVAIAPHHLGFWSLNACRIVYILDEENNDVRKFGFAYGTLRDHAETGEERFSIEWRRRDNSVWYDILAFSRPAHPLAILGWPLSRMFQAKFARDSKQAMLRAMNQPAVTF